MIQKVKIVSHIGDLTFAEGTFRTLYGIIKHVKLKDGTIKGNIILPHGIVQLK